MVNCNLLHVVILLMKVLLPCLNNSCITMLSVEECGIAFAGVRLQATALLVTS